MCMHVSSLLKQERKGPMGKQKKLQCKRDLLCSRIDYSPGHYVIR